MSLLPALTVKVFVNVLLVEVEVEAIGAPFVSIVGSPFSGFGMSIPVNSIHKETGILPVSRLPVQPPRQTKPSVPSFNTQHHGRVVTP